MDPSPTPAQRPDRLAFGILAYLTLPVLLFLLFWCRPIWGVPSALLFGFGLWSLWNGLPGPSGQTGRFWRIFLIPVALAAVWAALGGAGHFFFANKFDWFIRDAVLRDLACTPWPLAYQGQGQIMLLRCPMGYFLVPAFLAKITSTRLADLFLYGWTVLGLSLLLALVTETIDSIWKKVLFGGVIILFGGMDFVGWILVRGEVPAFTQHIQWWARLFQYSCNSTLLFWVPNHALPGWLGAGLLWRYRRDPALGRFLPYLVATVPFWSPFALIGLVPFMIAALAPWIRQRALGASHWIHALWAAGALALTFQYLSALASTVPGSFSARPPLADPDFILSLVIFHLLEWFLVWLLLQRQYREAWLWLIGGMLAVLPFFRFGPGNDLVMRGSIPALFLLCLWLGQALVLDNAIPSLPRRGLLVLFLIGCLTPMEEISRSLLKQRWAPSQTRTLEDANQGRIPSHYAVPYTASGLFRIIRNPSIVPPGPKEPHDQPSSAENQ